MTPADSGKTKSVASCELQFFERSNTLVNPLSGLVGSLYIHKGRQQDRHPPQPLTEQTQSRKEKPCPQAVPSSNRRHFAFRRTRTYFDYPSVFR
jgi:hypothetical protein